MNANVSTGFNVQQIPKPEEFFGLRALIFSFVHGINANIFQKNKKIS
jgi:hypothetical protein